MSEAAFYRRIDRSCAPQVAKWCACRIQNLTISELLYLVFTKLFAFQNLTGFSLTLKHGFYENNVNMFLAGVSLTSFPLYRIWFKHILAEATVFKKLWDMLIVKCPNLEELVLNGISSVPADIHHVVEGRWPKLRKLFLGDVCVDWFPMSITPNEKRPFITFLEAHPFLELLKVSRHTIQPHYLSALSPSALERLISFSGTLYQLQAMIHLHPQVKSVSFSDPVEARDVSSLAVSRLLRDLKSLVELKISFTQDSVYDGGNLIKSLVQSCPDLRHLKLTCKNKPSFQLVNPYLYRFLMLFWYGHW